MQNLKVIMNLNLLGDILKGPLLLSSAERNCKCLYFSVILSQTLQQIPSCSRDFKLHWTCLSSAQQNTTDHAFVAVLYVL